MTSTPHRRKPQTNQNLLPSVLRSISVEQSPCFSSIYTNFCLKIGITVGSGVFERETAPAIHKQKRWVNKPLVFWNIPTNQVSEPLITFKAKIPIHFVLTADPITKEEKAPFRPLQFHLLTPLPTPSLHIDRQTIPNPGMYVCAHVGVLLTTSRQT